MKFRPILLFCLFAAGPALAADPTLFPAPAAKDVCPDTPLQLAFSTPPALGTGKIQIFDAADNSLVEAIDAAVKTKSKSIGGITGFNYYPIIITGNDAAIIPEKPLAYGKTYYVTVDAGALTGANAISDPQAWRFTTRPAPPAAGQSQITIDAAGTGDFCTVQAAVDSLPAGNTAPVTLFIKAGTYSEMVVVNAKHHLTFLGEDRKKTVIVYPDNARLNPTGSPYRRGMFLVNRSNDFTLANLTLKNTTPKGGSQAETLITVGNVNSHALVTHADFLSLQDTIQINGQGYVSDCYIEGDVDFMWGSGPTFFENCECKSMNSKAYYTQIRNPASNHGYVYSHCLFDGKEGVIGNFLSRIEPGRFPASEVVLLDCTLTKAVGAAAWRFDGNNTSPNVHFWEYNSHDPDGAPIDMSGRFASSKRLVQPADADTIANYSNPVWVLGGSWTPALAPIITTQPAPVSVAAGQKASLTVDVAAVPAPTYQWQKNGVDITSATKATYLIDSAGPGDVGSYTVVITNSAGKITSSSAALQLGK